MHPPRSLTTKLLAMGAVFLLVALGSIGLTLWVTWKLEGGAAVNEAGRLRMAMLRMVMVMQTEPPAAVHERMRQFDASLELLRTGDPSRPLFVPWSAETRSRFDAIRAQWATTRTVWGSAASGACKNVNLNVNESARAQGRAQLLAIGDAFVARVDSFVEAIEVQIAGWTRPCNCFSYDGSGHHGRRHVHGGELSAGHQPAGAPAAGPGAFAPGRNGHPFAGRNR